MQTKEALLTDIEQLLTYNPEEKTTINPNYLEYLSLEDLISIRNKLITRLGQLKEDDIEWLEQFKKYD